VQFADLLRKGRHILYLLRRNALEKRVGGEHFQQFNIHKIPRKKF